MRTPFQNWVDEQIAAADDNMSALARRWGVPPTYVLRWRGDEETDAILPAFKRLADLALRSGTPLEVLQRLWEDSARQRALAQVERRFTRLRRRAGIASPAALPDNARFPRTRLFARPPQPALSSA